ncbi:hydantoinase/oxoprolinase family protein [Alicyclobacillus cycloheptanicus]|uniref:N-methylhydantoinase A n=1 Tax=Alicyclobacillus cycloheptanicus TaxID=1457 RepID=A0ABT9XHX5_9BACL|nr:hydantoinase/oxoprolinase family protein [Alicyclobacillus cycloheptanicus]MDQ0189912.1 N-methylhydantoinase A [Alicyclobacillus cycloheptanicus]WDM02185.1 hydantoinase/oxoprolinase family protein [Alicyclobacillus cycloheptanicus]
MAILVGVDVGGTFTDILIFDSDTGKVRVVKTPSTLEDQSIGFLCGIEASGVDVSRIQRIIHGTTVGTNAVLERKGSNVGLITTKGFRDVLEMRRRERAQTWGLWGDYKPLVPRKWRFEVGQRVLADGSVREELNEQEVLAAAEALKAAGVESLAVCFLHSYANASHEKRAVELLRSVWPNAYISASYDILPEIREWERTSTTVVNAYIQPKIDHYLSLLQKRLADNGYTHDVSIIQSNGGVMSSDTARHKSVNTVLSGPAAGVIAAAQVGLSSGFPNVISADMGGTSFDVSLITDGRPSMQSEQKVEFGVVVRVPMIEITTIGAGGGSIAWMDGAGFLQVGPESAGSYPGPVAFGRGGTRPTVTDANVILGRIDADDPIGAKGTSLDVEGAKRAIEEHIAKPLGLDAYAAAEAILKVATSKMAGALRLISVERGHDPRGFALVPFGGAGPLHAAALIRECGIGTAVVPYYPGITSALGCITANVQYDYLRTVNRLLDDFDVDEAAEILRGFEAEGRRLLEESGVAVTDVEVVYQADMAYEGQTHTVLVELPQEEMTLACVQNAFEQVYAHEFSRVLENIPIRVQTLRATVIGIRPKFDLRGLIEDAEDTAPGQGDSPAPIKTRPVYFDGRFVETPVYLREHLRPGAAFDGPAIVEQLDTTTVVEPNMSCVVDSYGHLLLSVSEGTSRRLEEAGEYVLPLSSS